MAWSQPSRCSPLCLGPGPGQQSQSAENLAPVGRSSRRDGLRVSGALCAQPAALEHVYPGSRSRQGPNRACGVVPAEKQPIQGRGKRVSRRPTAARIGRGRLQAPARRATRPRACPLRTCGPRRRRRLAGGRPEPPRGSPAPSRGGHARRRRAGAWGGVDALEQRAGHSVARCSPPPATFRHLCCCCHLLPPHLPHPSHSSLAVCNVGRVLTPPQ